MIAAVISLVACSGKGAGIIKEEKKPVIRYVNLNSLYTALSEMEPEYRLISGKRKTLLKEIEDLQERFFSHRKGSEETAHELKDKREKLQELDFRIRSLKSRIYSNIDSAMKNLSRRGNIDFILNLGNGLVYSGKKYDITEDVMREILREKKRSSPVSR